MTAASWSEDLALDNPRMDTTHEEFLVLLESLRDAGEDERLARLDDLIGHTEAHFGQEDRWMRATGFAPGSCHETQHAQVLAVLHDQAGRARRGEPVDFSRLAQELGVWFAHHVQTMDAALAFHCSQVGFDTSTESIDPQRARAALPEQPLTHCGGTACS
ncbi:hemerythrin domain-containing protein [Schlegelella aquatica]|uniref:hemerythrin domain-containing protein n=1 Tax=Caldimonas aquatica TaxID=376175 RepID=UPI00375145A1